MSRTTTLKRIAVTAVTALAIGASTASTALADELPITAAPDPNVLSCSLDSSSLHCLHNGKLVLLCMKGKYSGKWACTCECATAEKPTRDELTLHAVAVTEVERYVNRVYAGATPRR